MGITYRGIHSDTFGLSVQTDPNFLPPATLNTIDVPGVPGSYYVSAKLGMRPIPLTIGFAGSDLKDYESRLRALADWLSPEKGLGEYISDNEPDKVYYAVLSDQSVQRIKEIARVGQGTITLMAPDPYAYGAEKTQTINDPTGGDDIDPIIDNEGTEETYPVFTAEVLEPITLLQLVNDDAYMQVGQPVDVDSEEAPEFESVLSDNLSSLANWTALAGGSSLPDGIVGGAMHLVSNADGQAFAFGARTYGDNPNGWVGPAVKCALSEPVQDFRVAINMSVLNKMVGVGKVVVFLADDNDTIFGGLWMEDTTASVDLNHARVALFDSQLNKQFLIDTTGDKFNVYNNFEGILRLERRGNKFYAYAAQVDPVTGVNSARDTAKPFIDVENLYSNPLSQIIIYIAKAKDYKTFTQTSNDLSVFKINDLTANQVPYIANAGDLITFDHQLKKLMLNGDEGLMQQIDVGATFFPLAKGKNTLVVNPADAVRMMATYREAGL